MKPCSMCTAFEKPTSGLIGGGSTSVADVESLTDVVLVLCTADVCLFNESKQIYHQ